jgi:hypothetical protein
MLSKFNLPTASSMRLAFVGIIALVCMCSFAVAQERKVTADKVGCAHKEILDKLYQYVADGDKEAFRKLYEPAVRSGRMRLVQSRRNGVC